MIELIRLHAERIAEIIAECEEIQNSNESEYTKERQMISAYFEIKELVTGVSE